MKNLITFLLLILVCNATAQQEVNTSFATQMNTMFAPLDKTRVPHGILLDFAMEFQKAINSKKPPIMDSS